MDYRLDTVRSFVVDVVDHRSAPFPPSHDAGLYDRLPYRTMLCNSCRHIVHYQQKQWADLTLRNTVSGARYGTCRLCVHLNRFFLPAGSDYVRPAVIVHRLYTLLCKAYCYNMGVLQFKPKMSKYTFRPVFFFSGRCIRPLFVTDYPYSAHCYRLLLLSGHNRTVIYTNI